MALSVLSPGRRAAMLAASALVTSDLGAEIVDRVAAIVGRDAITLSQVRTELHMVAFLNQARPASLEQGGETALRRLIERRLILQDLALTPFLAAPDDEIEVRLADLKAQVLEGGRDFPAVLAHHALTEADCRAFLRERVGFERYVAFRFKSGQQFSPEAVAAYYRDEYSPAQLAQGATVQPIEAVQSRILEALAERRANALLAQRVRELRALTRIEMLPVFEAADSEQ